LEAIVKTILLGLLTLASLPSHAATGRESTPIACNLNALSATERAQHRELGERISAARRRTEELRDGFRVQLSPGPSVLDLARWAAFEHRCCPFLDIGITLAAGEGPLSLEFRGPAGVKEFLRSEFALEPSPKRARAR
jgi:hypothetical protein